MLAQQSYANHTALMATPSKLNGSTSLATAGITVT